MKLKVYNKKVIDFVWENMMTSFFVVNGPRFLSWMDLASLVRLRAKKLSHHIFPYKVYNL
jgi:hypothetical protein